MNIIKLLQHFTSANLNNMPEGAMSRNQAFAHLANIGKGIAMAAAPFGAVAIASSKSHARTMETPTEALQLALTLEYLEAEYYQMGLDSGVIPTGGREEKVFMQISKHESAHVTFLKAGLGENSIDKPAFDFTAGGEFDPFNDDPNISEAVSYAQFLALAQAFEDTGVRAYKGQAANLMDAPDLLKAALQIHSVEARHASEVRRIRGLKGWIVQDNRGDGIPEAAQPVYNGEDAIMQAGFNTATDFGADAGTEAYDEPLTGTEANNIANLFIVT
ncbi:ferritin-like domain-containing protein [Fulvivirga sediminis]|uniref:Ferritin-like domain-containing protein n=1 Tax=Fulvivirga sediminis TaxID=2803949 RepID=A0A937FBW3_9BACT|nr:ferritin-like domain-containing protein [Fulvivirga sediminis]MBL3657718.1 ferritin-like domain-containing protein [Fulvivirga sediminis]